MKVIKFDDFLNGSYKVKKKHYKTILTTALGTIVVYSFLPIPQESVQAAELVIATTAQTSSGWETLIEKLLSLLDPIAKIFGMIAGVAIMTGNGKIGLERLFWLSVGYITTRKVEVWIQFLNSI